MRQTHDLPFPFPPTRNCSPRNIATTDRLSVCFRGVERVAQSKRHLSNSGPKSSPLSLMRCRAYMSMSPEFPAVFQVKLIRAVSRSEEHTSELQSPCNIVCRLL